MKKDHVPCRQSSSWKTTERIFTTTSSLRRNLGLFAVNLVSRIRELLFSQAAREATFQWRCDGSCVRWLNLGISRYVVNTCVKYCSAFTVWDSLILQLLVIDSLFTSYGWQSEPVTTPWYTAPRFLFSLNVVQLFVKLLFNGITKFLRKRNIYCIKMKERIFNGSRTEIACWTTEGIGWRHGAHSWIITYLTPRRVCKWRSCPQHAIEDDGRSGQNVFRNLYGSIAVLGVPSRREPRNAAIRFPRMSEISPDARTVTHVDVKWPIGTVGARRYQYRRNMGSTKKKILDLDSLDVNIVLSFTSCTAIVNNT